MVFIILNVIAAIVIELFEIIFYLWVKMKHIDFCRKCFTYVGKSKNLY